MLIKIAITLALIFGVVWALLPGGFGLHNYKQSHHAFLAGIATAAWGLLMVSHPAAIYVVWFVETDGYWWLMLPVLLHVMFFAVFGRDVSTG